MKFLWGIILLLTLAACSVTPDFDLRNKDQILSKVEVEQDSFRKEKKVSGPLIKTGNILSNKSWFLRSFIKEGQEPTTQIYVSVYYSGDDWRFLGDAATNGEIFPTTKISRDVVSCSSSIGCSYREDLAIDINVKKLKSLLNQDGIVLFGIKDRFGQNWVVDLTKEYIEAFESRL